MKKVVIVLTIIINIIVLCGCNNTNSSKDYIYSLYFKNTHSYDEYLKFKDKLDYDSYGPYSDGVRWVRKDNKDFDKNEELYGYIDMNGNLIVPLTNEWTSVHDFSDDMAFVHFKGKERGSDNTAIIDKSGNIIAKFNVERSRKDMHNEFSEGYAIYERYTGNNGSRAYIIDKKGNTSQITPGVSFSKDGYEVSNFKEGLCRIYANVIPDSLGKGSCIFVNTNGEVEFTMKDYWVKNSSDFENGQAVLTIRGEDKNDYRVLIDKKGNILSTTKK